MPLTRVACVSNLVKRHVGSVLSVYCMVVCGASFDDAAAVVLLLLCVVVGVVGEGATG